MVCLMPSKGITNQRSILDNADFDRSFYRLERKQFVSLFCEPCWLFPTALLKQTFPPCLPEALLTEIHLKIRHSSNYITGICVFITFEGIVQAVEEYLLNTPLKTWTFCSPDWCFTVPPFSHHTVEGSWPVCTFLGTVKTPIPYFCRLATDFFWPCWKFQDASDMFFMKSKPGYNMCRYFFTFQSMETFPNILSNVGFLLYHHCSWLV